MSGPKVIRVKTRAERIAEAETWIGRTTSAARRWEERAGADGLASADELTAAHQHAPELARLLQDGRFAEVERRARQTIAFLEDDLARRRERLAERRARDRARGRRLAAAADTLLGALAESGARVPPTARALLERGRTAEAEDLDALESVIGECLALLVPAEDPSARSERQAALAAGLAPHPPGGEGTRTLADWRSDQASEDAEGTGPLDLGLVRLESEAGAASAAPFAERARQIAAEPVAQRRRLLEDSLALDLAAALQAARALTRLRDQLDDLTAELAPPRRDAVLSALSAIGYEVREGMGTLWSEERRLVVRHGASQDLGLDLAGDPAAGRLQLRAVGFEARPGAWDHGRDHDLEQRFCAQVQELKDHLSAQGSAFDLERAVPAGTQPVRTLTAADGATERVAALPRQRQRERGP